MRLGAGATLRRSATARSGLGAATAGDAAATRSSVARSDVAGNPNGRCRQCMSEKNGSTPGTSAWRSSRRAIPLAGDAW